MSAPAAASETQADSAAGPAGASREGQPGRAAYGGGPVQEPPQARRQRLALALILVAAFMVVLDFSIVNVALPSIERELGLTASSVQWVITGYAIAFGGLLILGGRAADLFGRRRMFSTGLLIFTAASLSGGLAHDPVLLIASRVVQGAGAALVAPAALSLITTGFPEGQQRNRALGMYGATASIGFVAGQVLGGVLVQFTSWRAVFLVNVPVGLLAVAVAPALLAGSARAGPGAGWTPAAPRSSPPRPPPSSSPCPRGMSSAGPRRSSWSRSRPARPARQRSSSASAGTPTRCSPAR